MLKKYLRFFVFFALVGIALPAILSYGLSRGVSSHHGVTITVGGQSWKELSFDEALPYIWKNKFQGPVEIQSWIWIPGHAKESFVLKGAPATCFLDGVRQNDLSNCDLCIRRDPLPTGLHFVKIHLESIPFQAPPLEIFWAYNYVRPKRISGDLLYIESPSSFIFYGSRVARLAAIVARLDCVLLFLLPFLFLLYDRMKPFFNRSNLLLFLLFVLMAIIRFNGISYQLDEGIHPDERMAERTVSVIRSGTVKAQNYYYTLGFHYLSAGVEYLTTWVFAEEPPAHFIQRFLSALFSSLSCLLVFSIGSSLLSATIGGIASVLFGFSYMPVLLAHYGIVEPAMLFFFLLAFRLILNLSEESGIREFLIAGLVSGVAIAVKQTAGVIFIPFVSLYLFAFRKNAFQKSPLSKAFFWAAASGITFLLLAPYIWLDFDHFLRDQKIQMQFLSGHTSTTLYFVEGNRGLLKILEYLTDGVGLPLLITAVLGAILIWFESVRAVAAIIPVTVVFFLITSSAQAPPYHHPFLLTPFLAILAAISVDRISRVMRYRKISTVALVLLLLFPSAFRILQLEKTLESEDTRRKASEWCYRNLPSYSKIDYEQFGPRLLIPIFRSRMIQMWNRDPWERYVKIRQPDYYIQDSSTSDNFLTKSKTAFPNEHEWFSKLKENADVVQEFNGTGNGLYNPHILIYKIRKR